MPDWVEPVWRYVLVEGLQGMLRVAVVSLIGSTIIGVVLGTLLTIHFRPSRWLIRLYIEVFRGLPIIVTLFLVFYGLFRSLSEFVREPHANHPLDIGILTPGIAYSVPMILIGLWLIWRARRKPALATP